MPESSWTRSASFRTRSSRTGSGCRRAPRERARPRRGRVAGPFPMPFTVPCTQVAPACTAAIAAAVASPKSSCPCQWTGTLVVEALRHVTDEERRRLRGRDAERVHDDDLGRAGLDGGLVRRTQEAEVARSSPRRSRRRGSRARRRRRRPSGCARASSRGRRRAPRASIGDRALDHGGGQPELDERLDVRLDGARKPPDLGLQAGLDDHPDRPRVIVGHAREPGLDAVDAGVGERRRDRELVLRREHDAHRLLAVAQGRVVETHRRVRLRLERMGVQVAGPHLRAVDGHAATIPSGNGESFSAPPAVIRKLSSTRSPPPPSI